MNLDSMPNRSSAQPPALPVDRPEVTFPLLRIALLGVAQALTLLVLSWLLRGLTVKGLSAAVSLRLLMTDSSVNATIGLRQQLRQRLP